MLLRMNRTTKGRDSATNSVRLFEKNKEYDIRCVELVKVFLQQGWAQEINKEQIPIVEKQESAKRAFDPKTLTSVEQLDDLTEDELREATKTFRIRGMNRAKPETMRSALADALSQEF